MIRLYDGFRIGAGIALFLALATWPAWRSALVAAPPAPETPSTGACVLPRPQIRAEHPALLARWRDQAVRGGARTEILGGAEVLIDLEGTCLGCHTDATTFCDRCHADQNVATDCWNCHDPHGRAP